MRVAKSRYSRNRKRREFSDNGIIPLINIVFLLLVFFLLAGNVSPPEPMDITPPETSAAPDNPARAASLHITASGDIQYQGAIVTDLMAVVSDLARISNKQPIIIRADKGAPAATVLTVAAALRTARVSESRLVVTLGR